MPYQYIYINVPVGTAPFRTSETPETIVGGYTEKMNLSPHGFVARIHPLFLSQESNPESWRRYIVIERLLRYSSTRKTIYLNADGREKCSPNLSFIRVTNDDCEPVYGDVCIRMTVNQWNNIPQSLQQHLPHFDTYEEAVANCPSRDTVNGSIFDTN